MQSYSRQKCCTSESESSFLKRRASLVGMITTSVQGSIAPISTAVVTFRLRVGPPLYASQAEDAAAMAAKDACAQEVHVCVDRLRAWLVALT